MGGCDDVVLREDCGPAPVISQAVGIGLKADLNEKRNVTIFISSI